MFTDVSDRGGLASGLYIADAKVGQRGALVSDESFHGRVVAALLRKAFSKLSARAEHSRSDGVIAA